MNTQATPDTPDTATVPFLDALNSATGPAVETLTPAEAREVPAGARRGALVDASGNDVTRREFGLLDVLAADAPTRAAMQQMATASTTRLQ
ncbi:hypothetical protein [Burkholderia sp. BCC1993]|uniref:hypothetical protein n=1 Tax=Burkholderia sp. BCC1993 TaxID=2817444 RepID=UPI002AB15C96|nr:hypothetical protein [Burkholderia sp. BCC1993]